MPVKPLDLTPTDDPDPAAFAEQVMEPGGEPEAEGWAMAGEDLPEVAEADVRQWLDLAGSAANWTLPGRAYGIEDAWRMTTRDLDEIAPPLTRILNRYDATRRIATRADVDALTVAFGIGRYAFRNVAEVAEARREAEGDRPHLGGRSEAETEAGPEPEPGLPPGMTGIPS